MTTRTRRRRVPRPGFLSRCGLLFCAKVLCDKDRECVSEILYGHIGKAIDFYGSGKGGHDVGPKLFTRPWIIRMPRFIIDCWTQVRTEKLGDFF